MLRLVKIIVSSGLIAVLIWSLEWEDIKTHFYEFDPSLAVSAVILLSMQYLISAWKWQKSLRLHGIDYSWLYLLNSLCIAFFFNNFLPSAIGGDAYRAYRTMGNSERPAYPISAVIIERIFGLIALVLIGYISAVALVLRGTIEHQDLLVLVSIAIGISFLLAGFGWHLGYFDRLKKKLWRMNKLEPIMQSLKIVRANRRHIWGLFWLSILFQTLAVLTIAVLFSALGIPGRYFESGFAAAAAGAAGVIPLSINGIGIVEGSFVVAAVLASLPYGQSVIVALFLRAYMLVSSVVFGIMYLVERKDEQTLDASGIDK